jgi:anti-repressor protein
MSNIQVFEYGDRDIRTVLDEQGEPWWVAKDVCEVLSMRVEQTRRLDEDEKGLRPMQTPGGKQEMVVVNEAGLYSLILSSRKPEAKDFKRWITHEVVPSIRKHGMYATPQTVEQLIKDPDTMISVLQELKKERNERQALAYENRELRPKAEFYDAVAGSKTAIDIGKVAKVLNFRNLGRNRLFAFLRDHSILTRENIPYQEYIDRGYFRTIEQKVTTPDGETRISIKTVVFQRGVDYIRKLLIRHGFESEHMQMVQSR